jgi:hypothetical protein
MAPRISLVATLVAAAASLALAAAPTADASEPAISAARFSLVIDGVALGSWAKADGLGVTWSQPATWSKPPTVVLKRGMNTSMGILAWHEAALVGSIGAARDATLIAYDAGGRPVARYHLEYAWPSKVELGAAASGSDVLYESVTLTCEDIQRVSP